MLVLAFVTTGVVNAVTWRIALPILLFCYICGLEMMNWTLYGFLVQVYESFLGANAVSGWGDFMTADIEFFWLINWLLCICCFSHMFWVFLVSVAEVDCSSLISGLCTWTRIAMFGIYVKLLIFSLFSFYYFGVVIAALVWLGVVLALYFFDFLFAIIVVVGTCWEIFIVYFIELVVDPIGAVVY